MYPLMLLLVILLLPDYTILHVEAQLNLQIKQIK